MAFWITGDMHGDVIDLKWRIEKAKVPENSTILVAGDVGLNYWLNKTDSKKKKTLTEFPYTFLFVHGNHEARPHTVPGYVYTPGECGAGGGNFRQEKYPNLLFLEDGVHNIGGKSVLVMGGAYSIDKIHRLATGNNWWKDEQMSPEWRESLDIVTYGMHYDIVVSHTCPYMARPLERGLAFVDNATVDNTMEVFLEKIRQQITYDKWYAGHWHIDEIRKDSWGEVHFLYHDMVQV